MTGRHLLLTFGLVQDCALLTTSEEDLERLTNRDYEPKGFQLSGYSSDFVMTSVAFGSQKGFHGS